MQSEIGIIVASHGRLAECLVETTELLLQRPTRLTHFAFHPDDEPQAASRRLQALARRCDKGAGVIILVDLFGGTPGNLALALLEDAALEVVTGVNLPMLMAADGLNPNLTLEEATQALEQAGRNAVKGAGLLLRSG